MIKEISKTEQIRKRLEEKRREKESPIKPGEIFDPAEELKKVRQASKEERRQLYEEYKRKLIYQKEGLTEIQGQIIKIIRKNPDISEESLGQLFRDLGEKYGIAEWQEKETDYVFYFYAEQRRLVNKALERYGIDVKDTRRGGEPKEISGDKVNQLFEGFFRRKPEGRVGLVIGPLALYFRCYNFNDYAWLYNQKWCGPSGPSGEKILTKEDKQEADLSEGVTLSVRGRLIVAESVQRKKFSRARQIYEHEEQHLINSLFVEMNQRSEGRERLAQAQTDKERELAIKQYFRYWREDGERQAKDEILAYFKQGRKPEEIYEIMTQSKEKKGLYDYFADERTTSLVDDEKGAGYWIKVQLTPKYRNFILKIADEIFGIEYYNLLYDAIEAFDTLKKKKKITCEDTIPYFITEPLSEWKKIAERLLKLK